MKKLDSYNIISKGVTVASSLTEDDVYMVLTGNVLATGEPVDKDKAHGMIRSKIDFNDYQVEQAYLHKGDICYRSVVFDV